MALLSGLLLAQAQPTSTLVLRSFDRVLLLESSQKEPHIAEIGVYDDPE